MIVNNGQVYASPSLQRDELYAEVAELVVTVFPAVEEVPKVFIRQCPVPSGRNEVRRAAEARISPWTSMRRSP